MNSVNQSAKSSSGFVSVVIVNYNGAAFLQNCLESVFQQDYRNFEVIVVDNASTDESVQIVQNGFPEVKIISNPINLGFAEGCNQGTVVSNGEFIVLLNNDTVVDKLWLIKLLEIIRHPTMGVVTSKVITDGVPKKYYEMNGTINYLGYNIMREFTDLSKIFFAGGASLIFRKEKCTAPFMKEYFLYHEDVFLSWRTRLAGYDVAMAQESIVHHLGSASTKRQPSTLSTYYQERNRLLNCFLFYEFRTLVLLTPYFVADGVTKLVLSMPGIRKSFIGILRSYAWLATHVGWIRAERLKYQSARKVSDNSIMQLMSYKIIDSNAIIARLVNWISMFYANIVGLKYHV